MKYTLLIQLLNEAEQTVEWMVNKGKLYQNTYYALVCYVWIIKQLTQTGGSNTELKRTQAQSSIFAQKL
jgi:hypothetical protein